MIIKQTKGSQAAMTTPTLYEFQKAAKVRGLLRTNEQIREFKNHEAGYLGEEEMIEILRKFGRKHWVVLRNIWLNSSGTFECDIILITSHCCIVLEIKNYIGELVYDQGACILNNWDMAANPVHQTRRAFRGLKNILQRYSKSILVKGALVLIGEFNQVVINDQVEDIAILQLVDLMKFIQNIKNEEDNYHLAPLNSVNIIRHLEKFETKNPFIPEPIQPGQIKNIRQGINCIKCQNYNIQINKKKIICECGLHEPREQAIIRTTCEYGVLHYDQDYFLGSEIRDYIAQQASSSYLRKILSKYLKFESNSLMIKYENPKQLFEKCYSHFNFEKPMTFYSKERCPMRFIQDCLG